MHRLAKVICAAAGVFCLTAAGAVAGPHGRQSGGFSGGGGSFSSPKMGGGSFSIPKMGGGYAFKGARAPSFGAGPRTRMYGNVGGYSGPRVRGFTAGPRQFKHHRGPAMSPGGYVNKSWPKKHVPYVAGGYNMHKHKHRHHRRYVRSVLPYYYYDDYYYYGDYAGYDCERLWRKYLVTGNRKWKYRYYQCIE